MSVRHTIISALIDNLKGFITDGCDTTPIKDVIRYDQGLIDSKDYATPILVVTDSGQDDLLVDDGINARYGTTLLIGGEVRDKDRDRMAEMLNDILDTIRTRIQGQPDLGTGCLQTIWNGSEAMVHDAKNERAWVRMNMGLLYVTTSTGAPGTSVYGEDFIGDARDYLKALLDALKISMVGYDPTLNNVYERHAVADLRLNAVTIGMEKGDINGTEDSKWSLNIPMLVFSVRVHTAYADQPVNGLEVERLLNSIANKFLAKRNLGGNYRIESVTDLSVGDSFSESASRGGKMAITVSARTQHTQE